MKLANTQSKPQAQTKELVLSELFGSDTATMTSIDIADLVGSRHDKVKQSIERLATDRKDRNAIITLPPMGEASFKDSIGKTQRTTVYLFQGNKAKRDSLIVVAQLSPEFTADIVDRWIFLETENKSLKKQLEKWQKKELSDKALGSIHGKGLAERKKTKNLNNSMIANILEKMQLKLSI